MPVVDCEEPHDNEVFALVDLPDGDFPEDVADRAQEICDGEAFTEYLGIPMVHRVPGHPDDGERVLGMTIYPTSETWADGDREVVCGLFRDDLQKMTGLQRGVGADA